MDLTVLTAAGKVNIRVAAWIEHEDKLLCAIFPNGIISLPGGRVKFGEATAVAIQRELMEETGEQFDNPSLYAVVENFFELENQAVHEFLYIYTGDFTVKETYFSEDEGQILSWLSLTEVSKVQPKAISTLLEMKSTSGYVHLVNIDE